MLTEADLNRIKGLLHFLNSNKPAARTSEAQRRLQVADPEARERGVLSQIKFDIQVRSDEGVVIGTIVYRDGEYRFGVMA